jgi:hypothetical protein
MTGSDADRGRPRRLVAVSLAVGLAGVFLAGAAGAQAPEGSQQEKSQGKPAKPAWQWTLEERLAVRFDSEGMKRRVAREAESAKKTAARFGERFDIAPGQHSIDGKSEPELFLPSELFDVLLSDAFHENTLHQREMRPHLEERAAILGFGSDLWTRLEKVGAPYLRLRDERNLRALAAAARSEEFKDSEKNGLMICRAKAKALADAKIEFGEQALLRLLYEAVAPTLSIGFQTEEGLADRLRFIEEGCQ